MNRFGWFLIPALLFAGLAEAQVAVPELVPAAPRVYYPSGQSFTSATVTPDNPAAITWGEPSRVAAGRIDLDTTNPAVPGSDVSHSGFYAGYRGVGERFSLGVEHVTVSEEGAGFYNEDATNAHLGFEVVEGLSLGVALDNSESNDGTTTRKVDGTVIGLSLKLQDKFYLGYAVIDDEYKDSGGLSDSRNGSMLGLAMRIEGNWNWHLAYDRVDRNDFQGGGPGLGYDATTITIQVGGGEWAFGIQDVTVKGKGAGTGSFDAQVLDLAWAPEQGLGLGLRYTDGAASNASGAIVQESNMIGVSISYTF